MDCPEGPLFFDADVVAQEYEEEQSQEDAVYVDMETIDEQTSIPPENSETDFHLNIAETEMNCEAHMIIKEEPDELNSEILPSEVPEEEFEFVKEETEIKSEPWEPGIDIEEPLKLQNLMIFNDESRSMSQNLCFVNAEVQLLASIKTFKSFFVDKKYLNIEVPNTDVQYPICDTLHEIFASNGKIEVSCQNLRTIIAEKSAKKDFANGELHDCQEFHFSVVDSLEKEFEESGCQPGLELMEMFFGTELTKKNFVNSCAWGCNLDDVTRKIRKLSLNVLKCRSGIKLDTLIKDHYEKIDNVDMSCACDALSRPVHVKTHLVRSPDILIIELIRYDAPENQKKSEKIVRLPDNLKLPNGEIFLLKSLVDHHGGDTSSGHYTAIILEGDVCYKADDSVVYMICKSQMSSKDNYLLCYEKEKGDKKSCNQILSTPVPPLEKVSCANCKKKYKHIYLHIKTNDVCATFYDLEDEKKKYNIYSLAAVRRSQQQKKLEDPIKFKSRNCQAQKRYQQKQREEDEAKFKARNLEAQKRYQQRLREEDEAKFKAKNLEAQKKYQQRLRKEDEAAFKAKNLEYQKRYQKRLRDEDEAKFKARNLQAQKRYQQRLREEEDFKAKKILFQIMSQQNDVNQIEADNFQTLRKDDED